jgi:hypothetical protein
MNLILALAATAAFTALMYVLIRTRAPASALKGRFDFDDQDVARLPDRIRLMRISEGTSFVPELMTHMADTLCREGFEDAGTFVIDSMPDAKLRLLANCVQSMQCAIWHHTLAGSWFEFTCSYPGGNRTTFTTLIGSGFDGCSGHTVVRVPGAELLDLYMRACTERPMGVFMPASAETAANDFENRYTLWLAWRRAQVPAPERLKVG